MEKKKKILIVRCVFGVLSLALMALIFWFSSQTKEESGAASDGVAAVLRDFLRLFLSEETAEMLLGYVRQCAHFFLYACLGLCVSIFVFTFPCGHGWAFWVIPLLICLMYACSDEIHQLFVAGRSGKLSDVGIDALGFTLTTAAANLVRLFASRRKKRREREK